MEQSKYEEKIHISYNNSLIENRYKVVLFLFRFGSFPLNIKSVSTLNTVYNATVIVCFNITYICVYVDTFVQRNHLKLSMQKLHILLGLLMILWTHFSVR